MIRLLRAEWIKLRTVTMNWVLAIVAIAFPLLVGLLTCYFEADDPDFSSYSLLEATTGPSFVLALLGGVVGIASITGEYGFGTIRPTFAATPSRVRVVLAKGIVAVTSVAVVQALVLAINLTVGPALARGQGAEIDLDQVPTGAVAAGAVVFAAMLTLFGYALGMIMRSTPVAVTVLILWPLLAEGLIGGLLTLITDNDATAEWMPLRAAFNLLAIDDFGIGPSRVQAGLYFTGFSLTLAAIGAWRVARTDA